MPQIQLVRFSIFLGFPACGTVSAMVERSVSAVFPLVENITYFSALADFARDRSAPYIEPKLRM